MPSIMRMATAFFGFVGGLVLVGALCVPAWAKPGPVYTVGRVQVSAIADDAVQAKEKATAQGQERALRLLLKRLTPFDSYNRFPKLDAAQVERLTDGYSVRNEKNSSTQYLASLDYNFQGNAIKDMLNRFGLTYTLERSEEISVLPVLVQGGAVKPPGRNPWQKAFDALDLDHMLTPMKVVPPRPDFTAPTFASPTAGAPSLVETLKLQYHTQNLVVAYADLDEAGGALNVRIMGSDSSGNLLLIRRFRIFDRDLEEASARGAQIVANIIEDRWKLTKLASQGALGAPSQLERIEITAEFGGVKEWGQMRAKLQRAPGMQGFEVKSLFARGASISLEYPGGAERLGKVLTPQGMILENRGGEWTLTARQ
jgi:hypothetical protein